VCAKPMASSWTSSAKPRKSWRMPNEAGIRKQGTLPGAHREGTPLHPRQRQGQSRRHTGGQGRASTARTANHQPTRRKAPTRLRWLREGHTEMMLGDMFVQGRPPGKLVKALSIIASTMHQEFDRQDWILTGKSKESCVLSSFAVRDFFRRIGFTDVQMTPVYLAIEAVDSDGKLIHSVGVGDHVAIGQTPAEGEGWDGHVCVCLPRLSYLVDTTVYQTNRSQWSDLPGMFAMPYEREPGQKQFGLTPMAGIARTA